jgi:hypothetical protein
MAYDVVFHSKPLYYVQEQKFCICKTFNTGELYIIYSQCEFDYHPRCVGVDPNKVDELDNWKCGYCISNNVKKGYRKWAGFVPSNNQGKPRLITGRKDEDVEKKRNAALGDEREGVGLKDWAAVTMEIENYAKKLEEKKKVIIRRWGPIWRL